MVAGKLLLEAAKFTIQRTKEGYDLLYAVGAGTAIGIASGETVRGSYELWKGTNRSNIKARNLRWYNRSLRRRFKGDVLVETNNSEQETFLPDKPSYRGASSGSQQRFRTGYRRSTKRTSTCCRRCYNKGMLRRTMAKSRFRKYRR